METFEIRCEHGTYVYMYTDADDAAFITFGCIMNHSSGS